MIICQKSFRRILRCSTLKNLLKNNRKLMFFVLAIVSMNSLLDLSFLLMDSYNTLPFLSFCIFSEEAKDVNGKFAHLYSNYGLETYVVKPVQLLDKTEAELKIDYIQAPPPPSEIKYGAKLQNVSESEVSEKDDPVKKIFNFLQNPERNCRKLFRFGGQLTCRGFMDPDTKLDGQKIICLDQELQVITLSRDTKKCLTLSFGVSYDVTFDIAIRDANCEVLMFDPDQYNHQVADEDEYVNIFEVGIDTRKVVEYIDDGQKVRNFDSLNNLAFQFDFADRLINILKMDIEGSEWKVLDGMTKEPYLDTVGQIAVEIHVPNVKEWNYTKKEEWTASVMNTFSNLQERGFRTISYFSNEISDEISIGSGTKVHHNAGELLLVNSNWYDAQFREKGIHNGLKFLPLQDK